MRYLVETIGGQVVDITPLYWDIRFNPYSFLHDFDNWWAFELRRRGL